jgi:hypothetical protein
MNSIARDLNPLEVMIVADYYEERGITDYTLTKGNDCIWAYYGQINEYFIFRDSKLIDVQID